MTTPNSHHENAPSSAGAINLCNCFESGNDNTPFGYADKGVEMHRLAEHLIDQTFKNGVVLDIKNYPVLEVENYEATESAITDTLNVFKGTVHNLQPFQLKTEQHVSIVDNNGKEISSGSCDLSYCDGDILIGCDHKADLGFQYKNAYHEPQMAHYGLGLMQLHNMDTCTWIENNIMSGYPKVYEMSREECESIVQATFIRRYQDPKVAQPNYFCRYCTKITRCNKIIKHKKAMSCYIPANIIDVLSDVSAIDSGEQMSDVLKYGTFALEQYGKKIDKMVKGIKAHANLLIEQGIPIPYYERKAKVNKSISSITQAWDLTPDGITLEEFEKHASLSVNELGKSKANALGMTQKAAQDMLWGEYVSIMKTKTSYSLKRKLDR